MRGMSIKLPHTPIAFPNRNKLKLRFIRIWNHLFFTTDQVCSDNSNAFHPCISITEGVVAIRVYQG